MICVATFKVELSRILNANGQLESPIPSSITQQDLLDLYKKMSRLRVFDQKAVALQRTGQMGTYASTLGQEAISTAIGFAMKKDDILAPFYRDYGAMLQRGVSMADIYRYWGGDERGSFYDGESEDLPICVPIASQCLHAAGVAFSFVYRNENRAVVTTIGDGGTSQGDFYEALNVAGCWNLPLIFVINNNQWAISVPISQQTKAQTLAQKAIAAGIPSLQVDGNDVIALTACLSEALTRARNKQGPILIEALSYRICDHTTADDASRYRDAKEVETAWQQEPLLRLKKYLVTEKLWDDEKEEEMQTQLSSEIQAAVADYLNTPAPLVTDMFDYTYAKLPAQLAMQRQLALEDNEHE